MKNLRSEGHRVLIFSMSKKILNILESIILSGFLGLDANKQPVKYMRIDGDTEIAIREQICIHFNKDPSIFCGLLTTKVGGYGLNLTGADRAIILDPDWNPANDNQAVDRCFRIGQKRDVIVYRLLTVGTIEEKIYRRQIYKKGMSLATIDNDGNSQQDFDKYFGSDDLFELFQYDPSDTTCQTMDLLLKRDGFPIVSTPTNDRHIAWLRAKKELVQGLSLNSNLYSNND
jgi:DNA excision repair protein ERCC-6